MPAPVGAVMVIVPVDTVQLGCVNVMVGAAGVGGCILMTILAEGKEVHPAALVTV